MSTHSEQDPVAEHLLTRAERSEVSAHLLVRATTTEDAEDRDEIFAQVVMLNAEVAEAVASRYRNRGIPDSRDVSVEGRSRLRPKNASCALGLLVNCS